MTLTAKASPVRVSSLTPTPFSKRNSVGWEARSRPDRIPIQLQLMNGIPAKRAESLASRVSRRRSRIPPAPTTRASHDPPSRLAVGPVTMVPGQRANERKWNDLVCRLSGYKLANPSPTFQLRLAESSVLGVGGEVEGLSGFVSIPLNFCGYSAVVGSITDRIREIRLAGKPPSWACLRTAFSSGATYMQ